MTDHQVLVRLGLTSYEAKAYTALIRRGTSTAAQVARLGGLPRQRVYDVLAGLVEKGLATVVPGQTARYVAEPPDVALSRLLGSHRRQLEELERQAGELTEDLLREFAAGREHTSPLDFIEVLREPGAVAERWDELQRETEREILVLAKPPYVRPAQDNAVGLAMAGRYTTRCIYEFAAYDDPEFMAGVREFARAGEEARFVDVLPMKLAIFDERKVIFAMSDPAAGPATLTSLVVEHPELARTLKLAFDAIWDRGAPLPDEGREATSRVPGPAGHSPV